MNNEIQGSEIWQVKPLHGINTHRCKVGLHLVGRQPVREKTPPVVMASDHSDRGARAFIAAASDRNVVKVRRRAVFGRKLRRKIGIVWFTLSGTNGGLCGNMFS